MCYYGWYFCQENRFRWLAIWLWMYIIFFLKLVVDIAINDAGFSCAGISEEYNFICSFSEGRWRYWHKFYIFKKAMISWSKSIMNNDNNPANILVTSFKIIINGISWLVILKLEAYIMIGQQEYLNYFKSSSHDHHKRRNCRSKTSQYHLSQEKALPHIT